MRKLFVAVAALGMLLTSCAKDESQAGGNAAVVSFNIAQPTIASRALGTADATQAYGTGYTAEDLQYAIYEAVKDAEGNYTIRENGQEPISGVVDGFFAGNELKNTLKGIRLVRGKKYIALFFAQSDYANGHWAVNWDNQQISLKDEAALKAQDESMDAFFACVPFDVDAVASAQTVDAVLKRPFAQVNVLANDAEEAQAAGLDVYQSSIVVEGVYTAMNLVTGEVSGEKTLTYDMAEVGSKYMTVNGTTYDLLSMNYLLVNARKTVDITFNYNEDATVAGNDNTVFTAQFDMVPVERNYRTNIMGSILTSDVTFEIVINPIFNEPFIDASKTPEEQLVEAAEQGGTYSLGSDVQLTSTLVVEKDFTLDLNGKTLSNPVVVRSAAPATDVIVVKEGATLTIEGDGVVEAVSGYDGYAVIAEGEVVINGGTFKAGVDADGAANAVVYARGKGEVYVNSGYFPNDANSAFVLNKKDADRATTTIEVKGGQFVNFNPANNAAETAGTNFMAKGYTVEAAEVDGKTVYTVVEIEVTPLATPVVEAAVEGKVVTLTWKAVEGAAKYAVTVGEETVEVEATTYEFTGDWETEYVFSVKAIAADTEWHTDSAAAEVKALTEAKPADEPEEPVYTTVEEFLAAQKDESDTAPMYTLKGTITAVANTTYGNFDLTDDTGTVYIYGLMSPDGATNKYWATSGAKLGDDIVIKTVRTDFNGTPQGKNAWFVELLPGTRAFYTVDPAAVDFASAGGEEDIEVFAYNTTAAVTATSDNAAFAVEVNGYVVTVTAAANELEEDVTGNITITVGDLAPTVVKATLAAKPAEGVVEGGSDDFHTISATNTSYVSGKTSAGWDYKNCAIFKGGTSDSSPAFKMIGDASNRALCMNGKTSAVGSITSPTFTTGCGTLTFNYGLPFGDTKIKFQVDIMQNGAVVKTFTVDKSSATKYTKYSHEEVVNVAGDFQIVFKNLSPSNSTSNKDRTAIWDVEWTGYAE